ncbi:MAG TPA: family 78 glycoside hydrolase catalytic domain [Planctomycetota bacterium]
MGSRRALGLLLGGLLVAGALAAALGLPRRAQEPPQGSVVVVAEDELDAPAGLGLGRLLCERREDPLGLETRAPRFSWELVALDPARRGLGQSAYRILVASSLAELEAGRGDLWDSGTVSSRETLDVAYAGRALRAFEVAFWKVRVADQNGMPSEWSAPARFGMGALARTDWQAQWIGFDAPLASEAPPPDLEEVEWLASAAGAAEIWLRRRFEIEGAFDARALLLVAAADEGEVLLNGKPVWQGKSLAGLRRNAEVTQVGSALRHGTNVLAARVRAAGGAPAALRLRLLLAPRTDGPEVRADGEWRVHTRAEVGWSTLGFDERAWEAAALLAPDDERLPEVDAPALYLPPPRLLRSEFTLRAAPVRAVLYASALGLYSLELNGTRAHDDWFAPGWTDYAQRVPYRAHDVTALLRAGENALGVVLADGWYAGSLGRRGQRGHYGTATRFLGQLVLEYPDGTRELVRSDGSWQAAIGPWREADLYHGERYDARLEQRGWSEPGFDAAKWRPVDVGASGIGPLATHGGAPIRTVAELAPIASVVAAPGVVRHDFGQNLAGVVRLALEAPAGTVLTLRFAEALEPDGTLMRRNLSWARATDRYVCKGGGRETWTPRFTYHGFRHVEVSGLPAEASAEVTALALSSATRMVGQLECSDAVVNRIVENARWTLRANSMDVPTDCPQRGERLGWTGDAQLFAPSALWLADLHALYDKWGRDLIDAQLDDGRFPSTVPGFAGMGTGGPGWEDAGVLVPARVLAMSGDRALAERQLDSMRLFLAACEARAGEGLAPPDEIEGFGDWHALAGETPLGLLQLAYLARSARTLADLERTLGHAAEAERAHALYARACRAFVARFVDAEGRVAGGTQTAYALALNERLVPAGQRDAAGAHLLADLAARGGLTTGFLGTPELLPALSVQGRSDEAYRLLRRRDFPSWGYMVAQGATTTWETWDAWTPEKGFAKDGRASLNHTPLGSVVAWLFEHAAGIRPSAPGFAQVELVPEIGGGLAWLAASHDSPRGRVALRWEVLGEEVRVAVELPPNVGATLQLATRAPLLEGGRPLAEVKGVRELGRIGERVLLTLSSGRYAFTTRRP